MYAQDRAKQIVDELATSGVVKVGRAELLLQPDLMDSLKKEMSGRNMTASAEASFVDQTITYRLEGHERKPAQNG